MPSSGLRPGASAGGLSADYEAALGKYTAETPNGSPGLYFAGNDEPGDGPWIDTYWDEVDVEWSWGSGGTAVVATIRANSELGAGLNLGVAGGGSYVSQAGIAGEPTYTELRMTADQTASPFVIKNSAGTVKHSLGPSDAEFGGTTGAQRSVVGASGLVLRSSANAYQAGFGRATENGRNAAAVFGPSNGDVMLLADGGHLLAGVKTTAPADATLTAWNDDFGPSSDLLGIWIDEASNKLMFRIRYSGGTFKSGEVALT